MQNRPGVRQIAADRASRLPWLAPPAGYIVLIQDVAYGNRYKIARHQQLDAHQIKRGADFPFETRVVLILEAENAEQAERDLQDELAAGTAIGDWFDLEQSGFQQLLGSDAGGQAGQSLRSHGESLSSLLKQNQPKTPRRRSTAHRRTDATRTVSARSQTGGRRQRSTAHRRTGVATSVSARSRRGERQAREVGNGGSVAQPRSRRRGGKFVRFIAMLLLLGVVYSVITQRNVLSGLWRLAESVIPPTVTSTTVPPTATATDKPTATATDKPTATATDKPTAMATDKPTATATDKPTATATDKPTATATDKPTATATDKPTATATDKPTATATDKPTATATDKPPALRSTAITEPKYVVETAGGVNANIRSCPSTTCDIVAKYPPSTEVDVLGRVRGETVYDTDVWLEIDFEGGSAFIHSELAEVPSLSQPSSSSASLESFSSLSRKYTHSSVNVRTGPGTHYPLLDSVPAGTALEVVGKSGEWYLIRRGGREGYIAGWLTHDSPLPVSGEAQGSGTQETTVNRPIGQDAVAVQVIDGDTIDVRLDSGTVRVRYIGVDTPERGEPCYVEATNYNRSLVQGKTLTLVRDTSDYGPYGRLLRYVYVDGVFVNLALVRAGYAEASYYAPNGKHRHDFEAAQSSAPNRGCLGAPTQPNQSQATSASVDNCCYIGWQCNTEDEWKQGYFAFQNNQCERSLQPEQRNNQRYGSCQASYVRNCTHARSLGCSNIPRGHPAYRPALDRDKDGIGCE